MLQMSTRARVKYKYNDFHACVMRLQFTSAYICSKKTCCCSLNKLLFLIILTVLFTMQSVEYVEYQKDHRANNYRKMHARIKQCRPRASRPALSYFQHCLHIQNEVKKKISFNTFYKL